MTLKCLTVRQPFASMIAGQVVGWEKTIEVRPRRTLYRGPLIIAAGLEDLPTPPGCRCDVRSLPHGLAICVVDVVGCEPLRPDHWYRACTDAPFDQWAWILANARIINAPFRVCGNVMPVDVEVPPSFRAQFPDLAGGGRPLRTNFREPAVEPVLPHQLSLASY